MGAPPSKRIRGCKMRAGRKIQEARVLNILRKHLVNQYVMFLSVASAETRNNVGVAMKNNNDKLAIRS